MSIVVNFITNQTAKGREQRFFSPLFDIASSRSIVTKLRKDLRINNYEIFVHDKF